MKSSEIRANVLADMWLVPKVNFEKYLCSIYVAPMLQKPLRKELMKNEVWRKFDWRTEKILEHPISVDSPKDSPTLISIRRSIVKIHAKRSWIHSAIPTLKGEK